MAASLHATTKNATPSGRVGLFCKNGMIGAFIFPPACNLLQFGIRLNRRAQDSLSLLNLASFPLRKLRMNRIGSASPNGLLRPLERPPPTDRHLDALSILLTAKAQFLLELAGKDLVNIFLLLSFFTPVKSAGYDPAAIRYTAASFTFDRYSLFRLGFLADLLSTHLICR